MQVANVKQRQILPRVGKIWSSTPQNRTYRTGDYKEGEDTILASGAETALYQKQGYYGKHPSKNSLASGAETALYRRARIQSSPAEVGVFAAGVISDNQSCQRRATYVIISRRRCS